MSSGADGAASEAPDRRTRAVGGGFGLRAIVVAAVLLPLAGLATWTTLAAHADPAKALAGAAVVAILGVVLAAWIARPLAEVARRSATLVDGDLAPASPEDLRVGAPSILVAREIREIAEDLDATRAAIAAATARATGLGRAGARVPGAGVAASLASALDTTSASLAREDAVRQEQDQARRAAEALVLAIREAERLGVAHAAAIEAARQAVFALAASSAAVEEGLPSIAEAATRALGGERATHPPLAMDDLAAAARRAAERIRRHADSARRIGEALDALDRVADESDLAASGSTAHGADIAASSTRMRALAEDVARSAGAIRTLAAAVQEDSGAAALAVNAQVAATQLAAGRASRADEESRALRTALAEAADALASLVSAGRERRDAEGRLTKAVEAAASSARAPLEVVVGATRAAEDLVRLTGGVPRPAGEPTSTGAPVA